MTFAAEALRWPVVARVSAGAIALAAIAGEVLFFMANQAEVGSIPALWGMTAYLTDWSNTAVALVFGGLALGVRRFARSAVLGVPVVILLSVGAGYAALGGWSGLMQKPATDILTHVVTPWLSLAFWLVFVRPGAVGLKTIGGWLILPAVYFACAIGRGVTTGAWPYPFMDPAEVGWGGTLAFTAGMLILAAVFALVLVGLDRAAGRTRGEVSSG